MFKTVSSLVRCRGFKYVWKRKKEEKEEDNYQILSIIRLKQNKGKQKSWKYPNALSNSALFYKFSVPKKQRWKMYDKSFDQLKLKTISFFGIAVQKFCCC